MENKLLSRFNLNAFSAGLIICQFFSLVVFSQSTIRGTVLSDRGEPVYFVTVVLKRMSDSVTMSSTYTSEAGFFEFKKIVPGQYLIQIGGIGYQKHVTSVSTDFEQQVVEVQITLVQSRFVLSEVIVQEERPIRQRSDTISFDAQAFARGSEQVVEDLLRNIPGLSVDNEGTIKYQNREIDKLMIEGDDLFDRGYKILSKNMPAYAVGTVELLTNFSPNPLLKDVQKSDKVALNIRLQDEFKRIWFGNASAALDVGGNKGRELNGTLMNVGKANKFYFLANTNNIGYDATGDVEQLIQPFQLQGESEVGDNQRANTFLDLAMYPSQLQKNRTFFNNARLVAPSAIVNLGKKIKVKGIGAFFADSNPFVRSKLEEVRLNGVEFSNSEADSLRAVRASAFGRLEASYQISRTKLLEAVTKFNAGSLEQGTSMVFNRNQIGQELTTANHFFDSRISFTNKISLTDVLRADVRFIRDKFNQDFRTGAIFLGDFGQQQTSTGDLRQRSDNDMLFWGLEIKWLRATQKKHFSELKFGSSLRFDELSSKLNIPVFPPNGNSFRTDDAYLTYKYRYQLGRLALIGTLGTHRISNTSKTSAETDKQNGLFFNPTFSADLKINMKSRLFSSYTVSNTNLGVQEIYPHPIVTNFRSFTTGVGRFNQLQSSSLIINYESGSWEDRYFFNFFLLYNRHHDFISSISTITQNLAQTQKGIFKGRNDLTLSMTGDWLVKSVSTGVKFSFSRTYGSFRNVVNTDERVVENVADNVGIEARSVFSGVFNFHMGTKLILNRISVNQRPSSFADQISFVDFAFMFGKKIDLKTQMEYYYFGNIKGDNTYTFLDLSFRFKLKPNKYIMSITARNMLDEERFSSFSLTDVARISSSYALIPRFILLQVEVRF